MPEEKTSGQRFSNHWHDTRLSRYQWPESAIDGFRENSAELTCRLAHSTPNLERQQFQSRLFAPRLETEANRWFSALIRACNLTNNVASLRSVADVFTFYKWMGAAEVSKPLIPFLRQARASWQIHGFAQNEVSLDTLRNVVQ